MTYLKSLAASVSSVILNSTVRTKWISTTLGHWLCSGHWTERPLRYGDTIIRVLSNSPAALEGFLSLHAAMGKTFDLGTRELLAVAVATVSGCKYCLAAHAHYAEAFAKLSKQDIEDARHGRSSNPKTNALLRFAVLVAEKRGRVSDAELAAVRAAGFSDAQITEIVVLVVSDLFTNLVNLVAQTDLDYPAVD